MLHNFAMCKIKNLQPSGLDLKGAGWRLVTHRDKGRTDHQPNTDFTYNSIEWRRCSYHIDTVVLGDLSMEISQ